MFTLHLFFKLKRCPERPAEDQNTFAFIFDLFWVVIGMQNKLSPFLPGSPPCCPQPVCRHQIQFCVLGSDRAALNPFFFLRRIGMILWLAIAQNSVMFLSTQTSVGIRHGAPKTFTDQPMSGLRGNAMFVMRDPFGLQTYSSLLSRYPVISPSAEILGRRQFSFCRHLCSSTLALAMCHDCYRAQALNLCGLTVS